MLCKTKCVDLEQNRDQYYLMKRSTCSRHDKTEKINAHLVLNNNQSITCHT